MIRSGHFEVQIVDAKTGGERHRLPERVGEGADDGVRGEASGQGPGGDVRALRRGGWRLLGRISRDSMRVRLQDTMIQLRRSFREALKDDGMQGAFDDLWPAWSGEQAAMIYADVLSALDLLLLTAAVDNRREIEELKGLVEEMRKSED